ncbi:MFS transporter [Pseudomonas sp. NCHU5208]|uniref:MFS transporter n=1 Tax=unclassified Pseudomonas TaxID=196821 RepID=UPI003F9748DF
MSTGSLALTGSSRSSTALLALACGTFAAGSYLAQPIFSTIAADLDVAPWQAGLAVSASQLGFCLGLLLVVPLGDRLENRRLVLTLAFLQVLTLLLMASAGSIGILLVAALGTGLASCAVQLLVPLAAHMSSDSDRGRTVGSVTAGLLLGILLARPLASLITDAFGWRALFVTDALLVSLLGALLARRLPRRRVSSMLSYPALLASLAQLLYRYPELLQRSAAQACLFAAFSMFWVGAPVLLAGRFGLQPQGIALFALAGAAGALLAPVAGRLADRGHSTALRGLGALMVASGFLLSVALPTLSCWLLAALLIDAGVQISHVATQRQVLTLDTSARSRLNGLYIAGFFLGGALGSALTMPLLQLGGHWFAGIAALLALIAFALGQIRSH